MQITLTLSEAQTAFIKQLRDEVQPELSDEDLAAFLVRRLTGFLRDWIVNEVDRAAQPRLRAAEERIKGDLAQAKRNAGVLFNPGDGL